MKKTENKQIKTGFGPLFYKCQCAEGADNQNLQQCGKLLLSRDGQPREGQKDIHLVVVALRHHLAKQLDPGTNVIKRFWHT